MTTHVRPTTATVPPGRLRRTWWIPFVVLGSIATGLVAALTLTLGVLPGATEAVVAGSLLIGFGIGWVDAGRGLGTPHRPAPAVGPGPGSRHGHDRREPRGAPAG